MEVFKRKVSELQPHPDQAAVYGDAPDPAFTEDIRKNKVMSPIIITQKNVIISGHQRWLAAREAGLEEVPVLVYELDDLAARERFIKLNRQRAQTLYQKACEAQVLMEVEAERAKGRMAEGGAKGGKGKGLATVPGASDGGNARDKVGEALGLSGRTVADMLKVKEVIDAHAGKAGGREKADRLKGILNTKGVKPAVLSLKGKAKKKAVPAAKGKEVGATALPSEGERRIDAILAEVRKFWSERRRMTFGHVVARAVLEANRKAIRSKESVTSVTDEKFLEVLIELNREDVSTVGVPE